MKKICVYEHWRSDRNECFYVGIGSLKRASKIGRNGRNKIYFRILSKIKAVEASVVIKIVGMDLTRSEAIMIEEHLISFYGRKDLGLGPLANLSDGGEGGGSGIVRSIEFRAKLRTANLGKIRSDEARRQMSISAKKKAPPSIESNAKRQEFNLNRSPELLAVIKKNQLIAIRSQETREKIRIAMKNRSLESKQNQAMAMGRPEVRRKLSVATKEHYQKLKDEKYYRFASSITQGQLSFGI